MKSQHPKECKTFQQEKESLESTLTFQNPITLYYDGFLIDMPT